MFIELAEVRIQTLSFRIFGNFLKFFFRDLLYIVVDCGDQRKGVGKV